MNYRGRLACLCVLTLALGSFIPEAAVAGWGDLFGGGETGGGTTGGAGGSVPIPGTFLLLAGGLAGLAWLRSKRPRD